MYSHGDCPANANNRKDPVNIVFYGVGVSSLASNSLWYPLHTGWQSGGGSNQRFDDHGGANCRVQDTQVASLAPGYTRFHIRLHDTYHYVSGLGFTSIGDAHHEDFVVWPPWEACGHAVDANGSNGSGFDQGRRAIRQNVGDRSGHGWFWQNWGNTQNMHQCDGDWARSDGVTVFVYIHNYWHTWP